MSVRIDTSRGEGYKADVASSKNENFSGSDLQDGEAESEAGPSDVADDSRCFDEILMKREADKFNCRLFKIINRLILVKYIYLRPIWVEVRPLPRVSVHCRTIVA